MTKPLRMIARLTLYVLMLVAIASCLLFAFNGLLIPAWYNLAARESAFQTPHGGYFVGALVMMLLSGLAIWACWLGIKKLS